MLSCAERWSSGRGLLAKLAEALTGLLEVRAGRGRGPGEEPEREAHHQRLDARLEQGDPDRGAEHEVQRPAPHPEAEQQHQHHREQAGRPDQRHDVDRLAVDDRDHDQREQVVHDHDREHERPQPVRNAPAEDVEQPEREGGVGGHCDAPPLRGRAAEVEREVDPHRGAHAADRRQHREHEAPPLAKVAEVELAPRLETQHEEEERHQPAVHPLAQRQLDPLAVDVDREHGLPQLVVRRGVHVHPHQRRDRRGEQDRRTAALGAQELAQRALDPARPRGCARQELHAHGSGGSPRYAISRRREAVEDPGASSAELSLVNRLRPVSGSNSCS